MKEKITVLLFLFVILTANAQTASVEKSVFGVQTGFLGLWVNHEAKLTNSIALHSEIGLDAEMWYHKDSFYEDFGFVASPVLTLEPRWYYNLNRRVNKSKKIENNSGNYISLKTMYHPDWFLISSHDNVNIVSDLTVVPTYGLRRHIGQHFNFEFSTGIGYQYVFAKNAGYSKNEENVVLHLNLRVGYTF